MVPPSMTWHYRKVQGTVTRTKLGQKWLTVRGQSNMFDFSRSCCVKGDLARRESIELVKLGGFL